MSPTPSADESNRYCAEFLLRGAFDPDAISRTLAIAPDEFARTGEPLARTKRPRTTSVWVLRSRLDGRKYVNQHVIDVLERLEPRAEAVRQLARTYDALISAVAYLSVGQASCWLEPEEIKRIGALNLSIWFDPYDLLANEGDS